jgi:hypothetical protein
MIEIQEQIKKLPLKILIGYFVLIIVSPNISGSFPNLLLAGELSSCDENLKQAEESYFTGNFEQATKLINNCLRETGISDEHREKAYIILTRISLAEGDIQTSRQYIEIILKINPGYQPTIEEETPKFVNLVSEIKAAIGKTKSDKSGFNKWILIGAGGVATTAIILLVTAKGGNNDIQDNKLAEPPPFP